MQIGEVANQAGVSIQTMRYYERRGLLSEPRRSEGGYRRYGQDALRRVRFIRRAQELGFTLEEIGELLALWEQSAVACDHVAGRATATLDRIDAKIGDLQRMRSALGQYVSACRAGQTLPGCPLLLSLGGLSGELNDDG